MARISPKEDKFYDMFIDTANLICEAAEKLDDLLNNLDDVENKVRQIEEIEHKGDKQAHDILEQLNRSFITPLDREDIYLIAKQMDDIIDFIEATAHRFVMFNVTTATKDSLILGKLIVNSCKELISLMEELKNARKSTKLSEKIIEINRLEDEGDQIFRRAITTLFNGETSAIDVFKWHEIYDFIEQTLDACEEVANTVEGVVMKHA